MCKHGTLQAAIIYQPSRIGDVLLVRLSAVMLPSELSISLSARITDILPISRRTASSIGVCKFPVPVGLNWPADHCSKPGNVSRHTISFSHYSRFTKSLKSWTRLNGNSFFNSCSDSYTTCGGRCSILLCNLLDKKSKVLCDIAPPAQATEGSVAAQTIKAPGSHVLI